MTKALLIDYNYCIGCHTCEVACQAEHGYEATKMGIKIMQIGPFALDPQEKKWQYEFVPLVNDFCDGCADRVARGKKPTCVHHCETACLKYGDWNELAAEARPKKNVLITLP